MEGKKRHKGRGWILLLVVLALALTAGLSWSSLGLYIAPQKVLRTALGKAFDGLERRWQGSPTRILAKGYAENGRNTAQVLLDTADARLGQIRYDLLVNTDLTERQIAAQGTVSTGGNTLHLAVYLNRNFAALTSQDLLQGGYYGIAYDTFGTDLRSIPLISLLLPDKTIAQWENRVGQLQKLMNGSYSYPKVPQITRKEIELSSLPLLALKGVVSREDAFINGESLNCHKLTYSVSGSPAAQILDTLLDTDDLDKSHLTVSFYLAENVLVKAELTGTAGKDHVSYLLTLGRNPAVDNLTLGTAKTENGRASRFSASVSTKWEGERLLETICVNETVFSYEWNGRTGDMTLTLPGREKAALHLSETETGFRIITTDLNKLLGWDGEKVSACTMTIAKGTEITVPGYKNLDQWSLEDLLVLLSGVGSLFGLQIP